MFYFLLTFPKILLTLSYLLPYLDYLTFLPWYLKDSFFRVLGLALAQQILPPLVLILFSPLLFLYQPIHLLQSPQSLYLLQFPLNSRQELLLLLHPLIDYAQNLILPQVFVCFLHLVLRVSAQVIQQPLIIVLDFYDPL